jgi:hypothetical protein
LQAIEKVTLLVLDDEGISGLAAAFPSVAAALEGAVGPADVRPTGGHRLPRVSLSTSSITGGPLVPRLGAQAPGTDEVRRASGSFPVLSG